MQRILLAAAIACCGPLLSAQCTPYSKRGFKQVANWQAGSTVTIGSTTSGAATIALTFAHDADVGVVVSKIGHRGTRADGKTTRWDYDANAPVGQPKGLWQATLRPLDDRNAAVDVTPDRADRVRLWIEDCSTPRRLIIAWSGLSIPDDNARSRFWMELHVRIPRAALNRAEWWSRMGRITRSGTRAFTLDEVHAPILYSSQPAANAGLARVLVPVGLGARLPAINAPLRLWQALSINLDNEHPARGQQMQFSATYGGDPSIEVPDGDEVVSPFGKILYFTTEDTQGHYKRLRHNVTTGANGLAYYRWCPKYYPAYGLSKHINFHVSPYPAVTCALSAKSDAWWYDVASHYRGFVDRKMGLTPIQSRYYRLNPDYPRGSIFVATSNFQNTIPAGAQGEVFEDYVDEMINIRDAFPGADGRATPAFLEWQKWLKGDPTGAIPPNGSTEDPIGPGFLPAPFSGGDSYKQPLQSTLAQIKRGRENGINMSVYTLPLQVNNGAGQWTSFRDVWYLRDITGNKIPLEDGFLVDLGYLPVPFWFASTPYRDILRSTRSNLGGFFLDTVGGLGSFLRYPPKDFNPKKLFRRGYNGGTSYVRGGQRMFDAIRASVRLTKRSRRHPDIPFVFTENAQEFYAGRYDFAQHGIKPLPYQTHMNPLFEVLSGTVPPGSLRQDFPQRNNLHPPLWHAVYHEYSRAEALGVMLSTNAVSAALGGGQPAPFPGLSWERWGDYQRMVAALKFVQGMKTLFLPYFSDFASQSVFVRRDGTVGPRDPSVPQQGQLIDFLARMHQAGDRYWEAGRFLNTGRVERPLQLPVGPALDTKISQSLTPSIDVATRTARVPGVDIHFNEDPVTLAPYAQMHVLHSVWRSSSRSRQLGLVLVNWTDTPAKWEATFDPKLYAGFRSGFTVRGVKPNGARAGAFSVGSGTGKTALSFGGDGIQLRHHTQNAPGDMPPRSVQVFLIDPK